MNNLGHASNADFEGVEAELPPLIAENAALLHLRVRPARVAACRPCA